ncbi:Uncharacterised protein [Rodentibacter pneumotropicus]|uniref:Uncharacterized protein n=1 Tax=Rodentibacter pneumotropicus TaxID=758 RepID=A0A448MJD9_9PAST|nr:Uncharacterised protein [Rodentibacter pneumotropicus]
MRTWEWLDLDRHQVFPLIYEYSYKEWIMDRKIQEHSKFGRYPKTWEVNNEKFLFLVLFIALGWGDIMCMKTAMMFFPVRKASEI